MNWIPVELVVNCWDTQSIKALKGRRVRLKHDVKRHSFEGFDHASGPEIEIKKLSEGFIADTKMDETVIFFPKSRQTNGLTLDRLVSRGEGFDAIIIRWFALKKSYEIEKIEK